MSEQPKGKQAAADAEEKTVVASSSELLASHDDEEETGAEARVGVSVEGPGYEIVKSLGKGGMGMVYLAREVGMLEREVALKTILPKHEDELFRSYFLREGNRQAKLHHPNILPIFTAGEAGELLYLSVYYARSGSLRERMEAGEVSVAHAVEIVCDVLSALHHAHSEIDIPMAHLDIKPENILFDGDNAFLADFGIAKLIAEEGTAMGVVAGDPRYWPAEQQLDKATTKSDIYALGVMFFELLCGVRPEAELRNINNAAHSKALARALPVEARIYAPAIGRCLNPNPAARPSADVLAQELRRLANPRQLKRSLLASIASVLLIATALGQPSIREGISELWVKTFPPPAYEVEFSLNPVSGKLWVDGQEEPLRKLSLSEGEHRVAAVAPGYVGETLLINVDAESSGFTIALATSAAATDDEYQRFINSFDGSDRSHQMEWTEPTLRNLVELDRMEAAAPEAFEQRIDELVALSGAGDSIAATSLFYASFEGLAVRDTPKELMQGLVAAADRGYPVASLLRALYIVQTLLEEEQTFNKNPYAFEEVESLLAQVASDGLPETAKLVAQVAGIPSLTQQ